MSDHYREAYYKIERELSRVLAAFGCDNVDDVVAIAMKKEDAALLSASGVWTSRDWTEDASHENGNYFRRCTTCGNVFTGHKRRTTCKLCAAPAAAGGELLARIDAAIKRVTSGQGQMRVPVDPTDPDVVLAECRVALSRAGRAVVSEEFVASFKECLGMLEDAYEGEENAAKDYGVDKAIERAQKRLDEELRGR